MFTEKVTPRFGDADGLRHINNTALEEWFEFDYIGQMYYGIDVEIKSYITHIGNSSFTIGHEAWQDGELKAKGKAVLVHFDFLNQRSMPIPELIKAQLQEHLILEDNVMDKNCK